MKPGAAPPSVKPTPLRAQDEEREPLRRGPSRPTTQHRRDHARRGRLSAAPRYARERRRACARAIEVIRRGHSCLPLRSCLLGSRAPRFPVERDGVGGGRRVDLSHTSAIQRPRETQGVDGISFTVHPGTRGRYSKHRPPPSSARTVRSPPSSTTSSAVRRPDVRREVMLLRLGNPRALHFASV